jgi:Ca-activated chloride channel family protein
VDAGLEVYGHRSKGDCEDIEILAPVGGSDKATLLQRIQEINPKGKTPISRSLELAASQLREFEEETTVVLVSDGEETCNADPCALVRELRTSGVQVRVHVVGFDVNVDEREQLLCIAEAGGGRYFSAANAEQLQEALTEVRIDVEKKVESSPPPKGVTFLAVDGESNRPISGSVEWTLISTATEDMQVLEDSPSTLKLNLAPGDYEVYAVAGDFAGEASLTVTQERVQTHRIVMKESGTSRVFDTPSSAPAGAVLTFNWNGPNAEGDLIFISEPSMNDNRYFLTDKQRHPTSWGSRPAIRRAPNIPAGGIVTCLI